MVNLKLLPHTPTWIELFKQEKRALQSFIGKDVAIEHIGSTAVPGLVSKPTIDLLIGVSHHFYDPFPEVYHYKTIT